MGQDQTESQMSALPVCTATWCSIFLGGSQDQRQARSLTYPSGPHGPDSFPTNKNTRTLQTLPQSAKWHPYLVVPNSSLRIHSKVHDGQDFGNSKKLGLPVCIGQSFHLGTFVQKEQKLSVPFPSHHVFQTEDCISYSVAVCLCVTDRVKNGNTDPKRSKKIFFKSIVSLNHSNNCSESGLRCLPKVNSGTLKDRFRRSGLSPGSTMNLTMTLF